MRGHPHIAISANTRYSRLDAEGVPAVIAPARVPKEEPDRHVEHLKLDAVDQVLAVPIKDHWLTKATGTIRR